METNKKLQIAYDLVLNYNMVPDSRGDRDVKDMFDNYMKFFVSIHLEEDLTYKEFEIVCLEYGGYSEDDINRVIRKEYFNS